MTDTPAVEDLVKAAQAAPYHSILEIWTKVLANADPDERIQPQWANRIVTTYHGLGFADLPDFQKRFVEMVRTLHAIVVAEYEDDPDALHVTSSEEDAERNSTHYINLLIDWQKQIYYWELVWDTTDPGAASELAAISEVHKMFFAEQGLTALLDRINLQFTDDHRAALSAELDLLRDSVHGGKDA